MLVLPLWAWIIIFAIGIGVAIVKKVNAATTVKPQAQERLRDIVEQRLQSDVQSDDNPANGDHPETGAQWDL
jgi:sensor domain CHASE-containing protein